MRKSANESFDGSRGKAYKGTVSANKAIGSNSYATQGGQNSGGGSIQMKQCGCSCACQQQTNQTSHMMSILSNSQVYRNNTMTLIKGNRAGGLSSPGPHTTIYGEESLIENGEIEEMHYLMVRVEKMKKQMLGRVEGRLDVKSALDKHEPSMNEIDRKEELLYRSTDLIEVGGDQTSTKLRDEMTAGNRINLNFSEVNVENQGANINGSFV